MPGPHVIEGDLMRTSTARRRIAAGLLTSVALAGSALGAEPASAATPTSVLYSTDGGTSWSSAAAEAPGATVPSLTTIPSTEP